jgi:alkylation response protein AidB-like acyl-CoA dehydrogenase
VHTSTPASPRDVLLRLRPDVTDPVARTARWIHDTVRAGALPAWCPGDGRTVDHLGLLADLGTVDLDLARLGEAHLDALAILDELGARAALDRPGAVWGVWAANPPVDPVRAEAAGSGWRLTGTKPWCSGAGTCDLALITALADDGYRMFSVDLADGSVGPVDGTWPPAAMAGSDSRSVRLEGTPATPVGGPEEYLRRPGFWYGAVGVAAVWWGGARGVARALQRAHARRPLHPHALAHAGAVDAGLASSWALLADAAHRIDADHADEGGTARLTAGRVRAAVEQVATDVVGRTGRALGAAPLALDGEHARRVADLELYLRQSHAERDLEQLGELALGSGAAPWDGAGAS